MSFSLHLAFPSHIFLAKCQFDTKNDYIICPDGYTIPDDAVRIHGITTQQALEEGRDLAAVVNEFMADFDRATFIVGHNIDFDKKSTATNGPSYRNSTSNSSATTSTVPITP